MGRLVQPAQLERVPVRNAGGFESVGTVRTVPVGGDGYQDKVAKYIPGEIVAAYMALDRMLIPDAKIYQGKATELANAAVHGKSGGPAVGFLHDPGTHLMVHNSLPLFILLVGLIFTPLYIRQLAVNAGDTTTTWKSHAVISTLAFLAWAYAIQGSAFTLGHLEGAYVGNWASAFVVIFTLVAGLFGPSPVPTDEVRRQS